MHFLKVFGKKTFCNSNYKVISFRFSIGDFFFFRNNSLAKKKHKTIYLSEEIVLSIDDSINEFPLEENWQKIIKQRQVDFTFIYNYNREEFLQKT
jgi:hypothetical protein